MDPSIRMRRPLIELLPCPANREGWHAPRVSAAPAGIHREISQSRRLPCIGRPGCRRVSGSPEARPMTRFEIYLRSLLRRAGLNRALRFHWALRNWWYARLYRASRPEKLEVGVDGWKA